METRITTDQFRNVINHLQADEPVIRKNIYYRTQKEHWLCFLNDYDNNQAFGRLQGMNRDAKFVYNHIVCPDMLIYLIKAIGVDSEIIDETEKANRSSRTLMESSGKIRKIVPWSMVYARIWGDENQPGLFPLKETFFEKIGNIFC